MSCEYSRRGYDAGRACSFGDEVADQFLAGAPHNPASTTLQWMARDKSLNAQYLTFRHLQQFLRDSDARPSISDRKGEEGRRSS